MVAPMKVLVVDDSLLYRKVVRDALASIPNVEVVGSANNGRMAIEKIEQLQPDLVTLDFEMPEVDGLGVLRWLRSTGRQTRAVMISAFTSDGATATVQALQEGAFDFVVKPNGATPDDNRRSLTESLLDRINTLQFLADSVATRRSRATARRAASAPAPAVEAAPVASTPAIAKPRPRNRIVSCVGIGISTGGPDALRAMLPKLPGNFHLPIVIVQHMPPVFTKSLATSLDKMCALRVVEGEDGMPLQAGRIIIAPGGKHLKTLRLQDGQVVCRLTDDAPVQSCRPSVDYLFESLADTYGAQTLAVIMTGMGYDGAQGCRQIAQRGGPVLAQDEASCVVFGMPRKPVEEGIADVVAPLDRIAQEIVTLSGRRTPS